MAHGAPGLNDALRNAEDPRTVTSAHPEHNAGLLVVAVAARELHQGVLSAELYPVI